MSSGDSRPRLNLSSLRRRLLTITTYARLLGLNPSHGTLAKILVLQDLLSKGMSVRKAIRLARLGWRNYYKYAPLIYSDPRLLIPVPRKFLRDYSILGMDLEGLRVAVSKVAKHMALKLIRNALVKGKLTRERLGKEWLKLSQEIMEKWINEVVRGLLLSYSTPS